jgi:hypothetical protein
LHLKSPMWYFQVNPFNLTWTTLLLAHDTQLTPHTHLFSLL